MTISNWLWNFGDGNTSNLKDPVHVYATPGKFNVSLTTTNQAGSTTKTVQNAIVVDPVVTSFTFMSQPPNTIQFTDTSTKNPTSWLWDFGDGTTSTLQNPTHTYPGPGSYNVTLTASNAYSSNQYSRPVSTNLKVVAVNVTNQGAGYTSAPAISFSGGAGSGASAAANMTQTGQTTTGDYTYSNNSAGQSTTYFIGYDSTIAPNNISISLNGNTQINAPGLVGSLVTMYEYDGVTGFSQFKNGSGTADGTYDVTGTRPLGGFYENPVARVTILNGVVTNVQMLSLGMISANTPAYFYPPNNGAANYTSFRMSGVVSVRKGGQIVVSGGLYGDANAIGLNFSANMAHVLDPSPKTIYLNQQSAPTTVYTYSVSSVTVTAQGTGYTSPPTVAFAGGGSQVSVAAAATAILG